MSTTKKRLNVTLTRTMDRTLVKVAKRDDVPVATKAAELLAMALEIEEDRLWDVCASARDTKAAHFVPHKLAWL